MFLVLVVTNAVTKIMVLNYTPEKKVFVDGGCIGQVQKLAF